VRPGSRGTLLKFGTFTVVMVALTALLFMMFGQYRSGSTDRYSAVFADASRLKAGDSVRAAGIRVGTVREVTLEPDDHVLVVFDADANVVLTTGSRAAIRYLNLVGDRYLELLDGPGSTRLLVPGSQIPLSQTAPALDLDVLLGGLKPVIQGLNPRDVNALTGSLLQIFQGQGDTLESLLSKTSSFTNSLADNSQTVESLIDNLDTVAATLSRDGDQFAGALDRLNRLVSELSANRDTVGEAIESLSAGTASIAELLSAARPPLAGVVDQLNRLAPNVTGDKATLDTALQRAPGNYRKLVRLGAYGSWLNFYICGLSVRVSDLQGRTAVFPWIKQDVGRCADGK